MIISVFRVLDSSFFCDLWKWKKQDCKNTNAFLCFLYLNDPKSTEILSLFLSLYLLDVFFPTFLYSKKKSKTKTNLLTFVVALKFIGAFRLYDVDNDGFITRDEMYNIVDAIYQMVVSTLNRQWPHDSLIVFHCDARRSKEKKEKKQIFASQVKHKKINRAGRGRWEYNKGLTFPRFHLMKNKFFVTRNKKRTKTETKAYLKSAFW